MGTLLRVLAGLAVLSLVGGSGRAGAATFTVNSSADATDAACDPGAGGCTFREAIEAAVATPGRDAIRFDPAVFVLGTFTPINLLSPLPLVADPAGTLVDGSGSSVVVNGGPSLVDGLVFASAPGVALADVGVVQLHLAGFPGHALRICGGVPPACDGDVSRALVRSVTALASGGDGIRIEGRVVSGVRVEGSVVHTSGMFGIHLYGSQALVGTRVEGCTARGTDLGGILLEGVGANAGTSVVDSVAFATGGAGIDVRGTEVTQAKLTNDVALANGSNGISVAADTASSNAITSSVAARNVSAGVSVVSTENTEITLQGIEADHNDFTGIHVGGATARLRIERTAVIANTDGGITLIDDFSKARLSDVVALGNNTGLYLQMAQSKAKRILSGGNAQTGIFLLGPASGSKLTRSFTPGNLTGILVEETATAHSLRKNVALGNADRDLIDLNPGCDANAWVGNVFRHSNVTCIH